MVVPGSSKQRRRIAPLRYECRRDPLPPAPSQNEVRYSDPGRSRNRSRSRGRSVDNTRVEMLYIRGVWLPHHLVPIVGDGACLFRALSFLLFNTQDQARTVRQQIVALVASEWHTYRYLSHDSRGDNYRSAEAYLVDMSLPYTYGSLCELMAAGLIYNCCFEVYRDGILYARTTNQDLPVRRLRFSDSLSAGHFDAYVPMAT